jgi:hypothetical protein
MNAAQPSAVGPVAQVRKGVGSDMILAKQLARLSYRGRALREQCQAPLPGCGAFARVNHESFIAAPNEMKSDGLPAPG